MVARKNKKDFNQAFFSVLYSDLYNNGMYSYDGKTFDTFEEAQSAAAKLMGVKASKTFYIVKCIAKVAPKEVPIETTYFIEEDVRHSETNLT